MPSDLDKLKDILFGHEKKALDALTRRIDTAESRTADVADVLPEAITQSSEQGPHLRRSLKRPLEDTLTEAIGRDPQRFAAALYPVIGPAIRRAIAEAMRSLVASMNRAIDTSLSPMARIRARRSGLSLAEYVLSESLVFRVDEVYLIDPRSGLLVEHVRHPDSENKDEDAVSAMLTAIQDFVQDSFSGDDGRLASASVGPYTVWVSQGPYAMLAAVIRGTPPADLRNLLDLTVEQLHLTHGSALKSFKGQRIDYLEPELANCLRYKLKPEAENRRLVSAPLAAMALLFLAGIGYLIYDHVQRDRTLERWRAALVAAPGIVVTQADRETRGWRRIEHYTVQGLRDPLAADPLELADSVGIDASSAHVVLEPYVSLEPPLVLARAQQRLLPPDTVTLGFVDGKLSATGDASPSWRSDFEQRAPGLAGVRSIDVSGLTSGDAELFSRVLGATQPPESVTLRVDNGVAIFEGRAPEVWLRRLPDTLATVGGLRGSDLSGLESLDAVRYARLRGALDDYRVYYASGATLSAAQQATLPVLARDMLALVAAGQALGRRVQFFLTGLTDGMGSETLNRRLRPQRAEDLRGRLVALGVPGDMLLVRGGAPARNGLPDARLRSVAISVVDERGQRGPSDNGVTP